MTELSLKQTEILSKMANLLYGFLPGSGAIYTFATAARESGFEEFWVGGSKLPALQYLLENTLKFKAELFPDLILRIVKHGIKYNYKTGTPITREDIETLNALVNKLDFDIQELKDEEFLISLPAEKAKTFPDDQINHNRLFDEFKLHPEIVKVSRSLFISGHYSQAIFEAFKAVNNFVKEKSRLQNLDGQRLMAEVFNENNPVIKLNRLKTTSERDEQTGFKFIFMGSMCGIRNPKAHDHVELKDPLRALKYLALASLLFERAAESEVDRAR